MSDKERQKKLKEAYREGTEINSKRNERVQVIYKRFKYPEVEKIYFHPYQFYKRRIYIYYVYNNKMI